MLLPVPLFNIGINLCLSSDAHRVILLHLCCDTRTDLRTGFKTFVLVANEGTGGEDVLDLQVELGGCLLVVLDPTACLAAGGQAVQEKTFQSPPSPDSWYRPRWEKPMLSASSGKQSTPFLSSISAFWFVT